MNIKIVVIVGFLALVVAALYIGGVKNAFNCPEFGKYYNVRDLNITVTSSEQARGLLYDNVISPDEYEFYDRMEVGFKGIPVLFKDFKKQEITQLQKQAWDLDGFAVDESGIIYVKFTGCL